jgi:hypothetical protein
VAAVMALWYLWKAPIERLRVSTLVAIFLVLINMLTWILAPAPPNFSMGLSIATPISFQAIAALKTIQVWFINDIVFSTFSSVTPAPILTLVLVVYTLLKYYAVYFIASPLEKFNLVNQFDNFGMSFKDRLIGIDLYVFTSLFAWIFVRNGGEFGHVAHAYILLAFLVAFVLMDYLISQHNKKLLLVFFAFAVIYGFNDPFSYVNKEQIKSPSAVRLSSLSIRHNELNGFYVPPKDENIGISQVKASMLGLKLDSITSPSPTDSQITNWLLRDKEKIRSVQ